VADNRPHPILDKVKTVGGALSALTGLVAWGGTYGFLTATQTGATSALLALVPGVVAGIGAVLTSFGVGKSAEPLVTPVSDPRNNAGDPLRPEVPQTYRLHKDVNPGEDASTY
jgi:hypothetical protein